MTLAAGVWLEGVNFAMAAGAAAAAAAVLARREPGGLPGAHRHYSRLVGGSFVLKDHKRLRRAPGVVFSDFVQRVQPGLVCDVAESFFTVVNPTAKPGLVRTIRRTMRARGISVLAVLRSAIATMRVFR
jgi:electron transfer flavoprotein-quinone oxidoreductase